MYVAFEGVDTCGKTTQIELLKKVYSDFIITKEPGGTKLGAKVRELALHHPGIDEKSRFFLFLADRSEHIAKVVAPNRQKTIISDRSVVSGLAYSSLEGFDYEHIKAVSLFAVGNILPDLVIILWLDEATLKSRLSSKTADEIERQGIQKLLEIQAKMPQICDDLKIRYEKIDASKSIEEIHNLIKAKLQ
ncbi:MAG: dTMP kinase [Campylobacteraceae bacterium]|nr:dTMP kinase [Campylobacteraceae bacterium]